MKQKTNGKIVIAILAMFAVAISIVGFTYAYFTASFNQNVNDRSVTVNAGELVANFTGTNAIDAKNVVPGWKSDGLTYYDATLAQSNEGHIFAKTLTNPSDYYGADEMTKKEYRNNGLTQPIQFSVANDSDSPDDIYYAIRLVNIVNGIYDGIATANEPLKSNLQNDLVSLRVHLYSGQYNYNDSVNYGGTLISSFQLDNGVNATDFQFLTPKTGGNNEPHKIEKGGAAQHYFVIFEYLNKQDVVDAEGNVTSSGLQLAQNVELSAKVEIMGVQKGADGNWYNADNIKMELPTYTPGA